MRARLTPYHGTLRPGGPAGTLLISDFSIIPPARASDRIKYLNIDISFSTKSSTQSDGLVVVKFAPQGTVRTYNPDGQTKEQAGDQEWQQIVGTIVLDARTGTPKAVQWSLRESQGKKEGLFGSLRLVTLLERPDDAAFTAKIDFRGDISGAIPLRWARSLRGAKAVPIPITESEGSIGGLPIDLQRLSDTDLVALASISIGSPRYQPPTSPVPGPSIPPPTGPTPGPPPTEPAPGPPTEPAPVQPLPQLPIPGPVPIPEPPTQPQPPPKHHPLPAPQIPTTAIRSSREGGASWSAARLLARDPPQICEGRLSICDAEIQAVQDAQLARVSTCISKSLSSTRRRWVYLMLTRRERWLKHWLNTVSSYRDFWICA